LSDTDPAQLEPDSIPVASERPEDVASAARSCFVIMVILAALLLIGCIFGVVAFFR
jgi:hypothetical protein